MRRHLYRAASLLGDLHAIEHNRVPQRIVRRFVFNRAFKLASWLTRWL